MNKWVMTENGTKKQIKERLLELFPTAVNIHINSGFRHINYHHNQVFFDLKKGSIDPEGT